MFRSRDSGGAPKSSWFRFKLRTLFVVTALIAILAGAIRRAHDLEAEAQRHEDIGLEYAYRSMEIRANDNIDPEVALALAKYHRNLSDAYRQAIYRPWLRVDDPLSPAP